MAKGSRNYALQRNYEYDSHDANHVFNGLTEEDWKKQILAEWSASALKANHVTIIFHDEDKDDNGIKKQLHAHGIANEAETMSQSNMMKYSRCSCEENCSPIRQENLANAYRYLLHITEKAIKDKKYIYGENMLHFSASVGYEFGSKQYHDIIVRKKENEDLKNAKELISKVVKDIQKGVYNPSVEDNSTIFDRLVMNDEIEAAMMESPSLTKKVTNAISIQDRRNAISSKAVDEKDRKRFLASIAGDEWAAYREGLGITLEECEQAQIDIQNELAK